MPQTENARVVVRVLIAVLMLVGPNPVRACTCAASAHPAVPTEEAVTPPREECGCPDQSNPDGGHASEPERHADADRHPHDPNCPAVAPRPVVSAILTPAPDAPADGGLDFFTWAEPAVAGTARAADRPDPARRARSVPLYISLLTLRN